MGRVHELLGRLETLYEDDVDGRRKQSRGKSLAELGGHPAKVTIYRAVTGTSGARVFKPMDYATLSFKFAVGHAKHNADVEEEPSPVLSALVSSKDVYEAPNRGEHFYDGPEVPARVAYMARPSF